MFAEQEITADKEKNIDIPRADETMHQANGIAIDGLNMREENCNDGKCPHGIDPIDIFLFSHDRDFP